MKMSETGDNNAAATHHLLYEHMLERERPGGQEREKWRHATENLPHIILLVLVVDLCMYAAITCIVREVVGGL
jgi:hypothetical protein